MEYAGNLIRKAHEKGALAMTTIGTSQEGADEATVRQIALMCKMAGADIHHIGDSGYMGMALPENITAYSVAIRGNVTPTAGWPCHFYDRKKLLRKEKSTVIFLKDK